MKYFLFFVSIFILIGCGGENLEKNSYHVPGSTGKIGSVKLPIFKEEKGKDSFFVLGPYITANFNSSLIYKLNWVTKNNNDLFQVEYGTLKEDRKEANLTKKTFFKTFQIYSATLNPLLSHKDYSCTLLRNSLSYYNRSFISSSNPLKWSAVLITKPSNNKTRIIQKLSPQWIFTFWQPKNWIEVQEQKSFFDLPSYYIWSPLSKDLHPLRSSKKNSFFFSYKDFSIKMDLAFKSTSSSYPTFWMTPEKIVFTGTLHPIELSEDGFIYVEKNEKDFFCNLYDFEGRFLKRFSLLKAK